MRLESRKDAIERARRAPVKALRAVYADIFKRAVPRAFMMALPEALSTHDAMRRFPAFNPDAEINDEHWVFLRNRLEDGYRRVVLRVAAQEAKARQFGITKADQPNQFPGTIEEYLKRASGQRIKEISESERERVQKIVGEGMDSVGRARKKDISKIRDTVGLTAAELDRIDRMDISEAAKVVQRRKSQRRRATTIARTEANAVRNQGLLKSWVDAQNQGQFSGRAMKEWVAFPDERISEICEDLNGQRVGIDQTFESSAGSFFAPPAHPNCRSTMVLVDA